MCKHTKLTTNSIENVSIVRHIPHEKEDRIKDGRRLHFATIIGLQHAPTKCAKPFDKFISLALFALRPIAMYNGTQ